MYRNKILNISFFFIIILLFAFYEYSEMYSTVLSKLELETSGNAYKYKLILFILCGFFSLFQSRPRFFFSGIFTLLMVCVWGISLWHHPDSIIGSLIFSTNMLLPIVLFFYFFYIAQTIESKYFYIGCLVAVLIIFYAFIDTYQIQFVSALTNEVKASTSYIFLFLLPLFILSENRFVKWGAVLFVASIIVFSLKRGGIISFSVALIVYFVINTICTGRKVRFKAFISTLFVLLAIYFFVSWRLEQYMDELLFRIYSIADDGGSSRDSVYEVTWKMIAGSSFSSLCLGHGWNMVIMNSPMELSAHNDLLEVIYDFGVLVAFLYIYFVYRLYKTMFQLIKSHSENAAPFAFSVITFTINSTIAHILIYPFNFIAVAAVWGYILGKEKMSIQAFQIAKR